MKLNNLIESVNYSEFLIKKLLIHYFQVYEKYPDSEEAPVALFQCGFLYDNEMKNYDEATKMYNLFLQKYPNHKYAPIVQQSLDIMGLDLEDIINKKQSAKN
jgi:tetratricopeptide (TPR) repeat protein